MKFTKITTDISYNINRKRYITIYYRRIPHFKDIKVCPLCYLGFGN